MLAAIHGNEDTQPSNEIKPRPSFTHVRFYAKCEDQALANRIFEALEHLEFESPELEVKETFSWDKNAKVNRYTVKCWYPYTMNYEDVFTMVRNYVYEPSRLQV